MLARGTSEVMHWSLTKGLLCRRIDFLWYRSRHTNPMHSRGRLAHLSGSCQGSKTLSSQPQKRDRAPRIRRTDRLKSFIKILT